MKKPLHMLTGVNLGDYGFDPDTFIGLVKRFKIGEENGDVFNILSVRLDQKRPTAEQLYEWAQYFKDNKIYFKLSGNYDRWEKIALKLTKEETERIQEIGGEYFLGDGLGEFGGFYATRAKGYDNKNAEDPIQGMKDCKDAKETYIRQIQKIINPMRENGTKSVLSVQAVTLTPYDYEAGVDLEVVEVAPRNMEQTLAFARGAQRAYRKDVIGAWLAHEFYGGYHQFDPLKDKRFTSEYYSLYLAGFDFCCLESGFREIHSHVDAVIPEGQPLPTAYLKEATDFAKFCKSDIRPGKGPITKVAFVQGNLDGFGWGNSSSLWGQYHDKKWGFGAPEYSYRILDEVYHSCEWNEGRNYGDYDYSGAPGYGTYDVIPATCPLDVMKQYDWVIFCGWNTMTPEIVETLKAYVKGGGNLFITAAHMRDSIERDKKGNFVEGLDELVGAELSEETFNSNDGYKFVKYSTIDGVMYPGTKTLLCDPAWSAGYTDYVKVKPTTAKPVCFISDTFATDMYTKPKKGVEAWENFGSNEYVDKSIIPLITENKYGEGNVIFMANSEYPGAPAVFPLYKLITKAVLAASHRTSDVKVIGSEKLRFAVYADEESYKVYIFNSDFNFEQRARIIYNGEVICDKIVDSVKLEIVEFKK